MKLKISNLTFGYKKNETILENINLEIDNSKMYAIIGGNGVGKSTLMNLVIGILKVEDNKIFINERDVNSLKRKERSNLISSVSQNVTFSSDTVFDSVMLGRINNFGYNPKKEDYDKVYEIIKELDLEKYMFKNVNELSGGEKQRVSIARALVKESKILYLDEITSNLDIKNEINIINLVKRISRSKDILVLFNIHDLNLMINNFDNFILLNNKTIYKMGSIDELTESDITNCFGVNTKIVNYNNKKIIIME